VAINLANSYFRRRAAETRAKRRLRDRQQVDPRAGVDPAAAIAIRTAVASLPRRQRTALVLRYYTDLTVHDVASAMGCPEGTVKSLTSKAIASLRQELQIGDLKEAHDAF
jgi:RNA polymerase sigma factor (sigma-70 family)